MSLVFAYGAIVRAVNGGGANARTSNEAAVRLLTRAAHAPLSATRKVLVRLAAAPGV